MSETAARDPEGLGSTPWRKKWILLAVCAATASVGLVWGLQGERLNDQERQLVGMWQWEEHLSQPQAMVLYFSPKGDLICDSPPFKDPQNHRWRIENGEFTLIYSGPKLIDKVGSLFNGQKDVYPIHFEGGTPVLTMPNGDEQHLIPYNGPLPESFHELE